MVTPMAFARGREFPRILEAIPPFLRYLMVGVASFATDFSVYGALTGAARVDPLIAHLVSRPLGALTCFFLNRAWTFRAAGRVVPQLAKFWVVFGASLALTEGLLALFHRGAGLPPIPAKGLAEGIAVVFNFLALKHFAFHAAADR